MQFKYVLKLSKYVELRAKLVRVKGDGIYAKTQLFKRDETTDEWFSVGQLLLERVRRKGSGQFHFRRRLPKDLRHLHGENFYIDEFQPIDI